MKRFIAFLKSTLLGGLIVVLPAWLAVLLVLKALAHLQVFVKPVSSHLPHGIAHPRVIAILVLIGLCFLVGALIQTAIGKKAERAAEHAVLEKIPGYTFLASFKDYPPSQKPSSFSIDQLVDKMQRSFGATSD